VADDVTIPASARTAIARMAADLRRVLDQVDDVDAMNEAIARFDELPRRVQRSVENAPAHLVPWRTLRTMLPSPIACRHSHVRRTGTRFRARRVSRSRSRAPSSRRTDDDDPVDARIGGVAR
jgi:hypothetical protein